MHVGRNSSVRARSSGIALVGALWVIALLSIIVAGVSATARSEVKVVHCVTRRWSTARYV